MANPIPQFHVPDTRPGYAFQDPGAGGALAGGLQAVLQALLQRQKIEQEQAAFQLEQQRAAQNASYQNALLAQEDARQRAAQQAALAQRQDQGAVGEALQRVGQPTTANVTLPPMLGGAVLPLPVGAPVSPEQAMRALRPDLVPDFYNQGGARITEFRTAEKERAATRRQAATEQAIRDAVSDLPGLRQMNDMVKRIVAANPDADPTAIRSTVMELMKDRVPEATLKAITKQIGLQPGLPQERILDAYDKWFAAKTTADFRPEPTPTTKIKPIPASMKKAFQENEQTIRDLNDFIARLGGDPNAEGPENDKPVNPGRSFGVINAIPYIKDAWGTYRKDVKKDKVFAEMATRVAQIRVRPLFNNAGKAVTGNEKAELNPMLNNLSGPPENQIQNARLLRQWLLRSNEGMVSQYAEGYEPFGSTLSAGKSATTKALESLPGWIKRPE